jgi:uncharacterized repeat protein (TIGR03803 family)
MGYSGQGGEWEPKRAFACINGLTCANGIQEEQQHMTTSQERLLLIAGCLLAGMVAPCVRAGVLFGSLVSFDGTNGANPAAALVQGGDNHFYGTAPSGGTNNSGTVFRMSPDGSALTNLYFFNGDTNGATPSGSLVQVSEGSFFGTTFGGGISNFGTVFRITAAGALTSLASFFNTNGAGPNTALVPTGDGGFYGATEYGGPYTNVTSGGSGYGVIFRVTTDGTLTTPVLFNNTNGANPGEVARGADGNFYGTTAWGGNTSLLRLGFGTIFKLAPDGTFSNVYTFGGFADGGFPYAGLLQGADGYLYGATFSGGAGYGTLFRISTNGQFTTLYSFAGGSDGANPAATLVQGPDGNLYGTTYTRGEYGFGTVFQFDPNGTGATLVSFTGTTGSYPGANPRSRLVLANDGNFYGATSYGGAYNAGTLFRLSVPMPPLLQSVSQTNSTLNIAWSAVAGQSYQVERAANLNLHDWKNFTNPFIATNGTVRISDSIIPGGQRFYRLALLP